MALRIKIKTDTDNYVHFDVVTADYTLCGLETAGDESIGIERGVSTKEKADCPHCIDIVDFCNSIKRTEYI